MSTKSTNQQQRRTPLSLTGGASKAQQNQLSSKLAETNGNANNGANAKNDNKILASQKVAETQMPTNNAEATRESTSKDVKKPLTSSEKRQQAQQQQQNVNGNEAAEKGEEKKAQNGAGKADKQQNGSDKQENGTGNGNANANGNATNTRNNSNNSAAAKTAVKANERSAASTPPVQEQKSSAKGNARANEKTAAATAVAAKEDLKAEEQKVPQKVEGVDKETRSRRHDNAATAAAATPPAAAANVEPEKKQNEKVELPATRSGATQAKARNTPTKAVGEKTPTGGSTPTKLGEKLSASPRTRTVTTVVDDVEMMEPLAVDASPEKSRKRGGDAKAASLALQPPTATSTPGRPSFILQPQPQQQQQKTTTIHKSEIPLPDRNSAPRTFTQIGGRRSIRPLTDYTPSKFQSNLQYRESYRRINTELDVSSTTNTSMNVTVGSEVPNNSSFSFFGVGRKRDRTSSAYQQSQSTIDLAENSPPKRARLDMQTIFNVVASPLTLLRSRFSRASIQSSTPMKSHTKLPIGSDDAGDDGDEAEVQNVSGISIESEAPEGVAVENAEGAGASGSAEKTATEDVTMGSKKDDGETTTTAAAKQLDSPMKLDEVSGRMVKDEDEILRREKAKELGVEHEVAADTSVTSARNRRCNIM